MPIRDVNVLQITSPNFLHQVKVLNMFSPMERVRACYKVYVIIPAAHVSYKFLLIMEGSDEQYSALRSLCAWNNYLFPSTSWSEPILYELVISAF